MTPPGWQCRTASRADRRALTACEDTRAVIGHISYFVRRPIFCGHEMRSPSHAIFSHLIALLLHAAYTCDALSGHASQSMRARFLIAMLFRSRTFGNDRM